jgi:N-acetylglucosaminyldiphosphoundecaprenol N-acetyl-beta-D-mannosaminyltransferase
MTTQKILGTKVNTGLDKKNFMRLVVKGIDNPSSNYICTVNPEFIMRAKDEEEFRNAINNSYLSVPDGVGVLMAIKYLKDVATKKGNFLYRVITHFFAGLSVGINSILRRDYLGERLAGSELIYDILALAEEKGYSIFLLGGWEKTFFGKMKSESGQIARRTAERIQEMYPRLKIVGAESDFRFDEDSDNESLNLIRESMSSQSLEQLDILLTAFPFGEQEKWLARNLHNIPASLGIGVGASFDFILGTQVSAPLFVKKLNLEWLFRLITQPWRYRRVLAAFPVFPLSLFVSSVKKSSN